MRNLRGPRGRMHGGVAKERRETRVRIGVIAGGGAGGSGTVAAAAGAPRPAYLASSTLQLSCWSSYCAGGGRRGGVGLRGEGGVPSQRPQRSAGLTSGLLGPCCVSGSGGSTLAAISTRLLRVQGRLLIDTL